MKPRFFGREHTRTKYISLNTSACKACWECMDSCPNDVINKIDLPWHKHALIAEPDKCTGCLKCMKTCQYGAYSKMTDTKQKSTNRMKSDVYKFMVNNLLLFWGLLTVISGLALQLGFHVGGGGHSGRRQMIRSAVVQYEQIRTTDTNKLVLGMGYYDWSVLHKCAVVFFSLLMAYHIYAHWKYYKGVIERHLIGKNSQIIILTVIFIITAITGFVPWYIDTAGGSTHIRFGLIEIHDKLALVLVIYLIWHVLKKQGWFYSIFKKISGETNK